MRHLKFNQKGSIFVLMAFTIPFIFALTAIAVDCGFLYIQKSHLQNIADAAALAGASQLGTSRGEAQRMAEDYIARNSTAADAANRIDFAFTENANTKTIRVEITRADPLHLMNFFRADTVDLTVHAVASYTGGARNIFDYTLISGATRNEFTTNSQNVLNLGPGGGNTYYGLIHANYRASQGGGNNTVNGTVTTVDSTVWDKTSQNSFTLNGTATGNAAAIDISVENSGLSTLINQIKNQNTYNGNFTGGANFYNFGNGVYVTGAFKPSYVEWGKLDTTTVVIAQGDIVINGNNGNTLSAGNHIIFCSLTGNITFTFNGPFYGILYAPQGSITLYMGGSTFTGSIVGKALSLGYGNTTIKYAAYAGSGGNDPVRIRLIE